MNEGFHVTRSQGFLLQFPLGCKLLFPPDQMSTSKTCLGAWPPSLDHCHAFSPQILWHFLHLDLRLRSLATLKSGEAWRHPKQMVFGTHPCNQDTAGENGTVVSGQHEVAPASPAEIAGICVSWVKATSTPEWSKKDGTEDWRLSVVPAAPEEERIGELGAHSCHRLCSRCLQ